MNTQTFDADHTAALVFKLLTQLDKQEDRERVLKAVAILCGVRLTPAHKE